MPYMVSECLLKYGNKGVRNLLVSYSFVAIFLLKSCYFLDIFSLGFLIWARGEVLSKLLAMSESKMAQ